MKRHNVKAARLINEVRDLEAESDMIAAEIESSSGRRKREVKVVAEDVRWLKGYALDRLAILGVTMVAVGNDGHTYHEPLLPDVFENLGEDLPSQKGAPSKWKKYGTYAATTLLLLAAVGGFYVGWKAFQDWKGIEPDKIIPQTNETRPNGKKNETDIEPPVVIEPPVNQTPPNQTPPNETPPIAIDTPDYLKFASSRVDGSLLILDYGIADREGNPVGNYSMRLRDANGSVLLERDMLDTEGTHQLWFGTEFLLSETPYYLEILRNGTLAHESIQVKVPNSPPSVSIQAKSRLGTNNAKIVDYSAKLTDDRGLVNAEIAFYDAQGRQVGETQVQQIDGKDLTLGGILAYAKTQPPGKYHVKVKVTDKDGSASEAVADVELPNIAPTIKSAKWQYDRGREKFVAGLDIEDPDTPPAYIEQALKDNGTPVSTKGNNSIRGSSVHAEIDASGLDSVYDWEIGVDDGYMGRAFQTFRNVWAWARGLAGHWAFDGNGSDSAKGNDAQLQNGAGYAQGKIGQALNLNGNNQYASVPDNPDYSQKDFTTSMWINAKELQGKNYRGILKKGDYNPQGWTIMTGEGAKQNNVFIIGWDGGRWTDMGATPALDISKWYELSFVYAGSEGKARTYLNGQLVDEKNVTGNIVYNAEPLKVGSTYEGGGAVNTGFWSGLLDDLRFYSRALTGKQAKVLYDEIQ